MTKLIDNHAEVVSMICSELLLWAPNDLHLSREKNLKEIINLKYRECFLSVDWCRNLGTTDSDVSLSIRLESVKTNGSYHFTDEEGNVWSELKADVSVSYPSYGAANASLVAKRLEFCLAITKMAVELECKLNGMKILHLEKTAQQAEDERKCKEEAASALEAQACVSRNASGMRIHTMKELVKGESEFYPKPGTYLEEYKSKHFELMVRDNGTARLIRID